MEWYQGRVEQILQKRNTRQGIKRLNGIQISELGNIMSKLAIIHNKMQAKCWIIKLKKLRLGNYKGLLNDMTVNGMAGNQIKELTQTQGKYDNVTDYNLKDNKHNKAINRDLGLTTTQGNDMTLRNIDKKNFIANGCNRTKACKHATQWELKTTRIYRTKGWKKYSWN